MKKLSIGLRLTLWYLAIFALAQLVFGAGMWFILRTHLYDLVDDSLEQQTDDLKNFLQSQKKDASLAELQQAVAENYATQHPGDYLEIDAGSGEVIYRSAFLKTHILAFDPPSADQQEISVDRKLDGRPFRFTLQTLIANGRGYIVKMGAPMGDVVDTLSVFLNYLLVFASFLFLVAASGGYWLSRKALSPVDELVRTARDISGTNLDRRLPVLATGDELQRLTETLNSMLQRIEESFKRVTQFTGDASHELRTPVALIRTEAELALRRSRGEDEYKEALSHILMEAERTTGLIEQLLALARSDSGNHTLYMEQVDLRDTLAGAVDAWSHVATIRNLQFRADLAEEMVVFGDKASLRRVADILLDNAFKYTSSQGSVRLSLERNMENAVITVRDSGIGLASDEHRKIFERFYRVDKARTRDGGGAGLGLSIAEWIVSQHKGSIEVESRPGEGAIFRVSVALSPTPISQSIASQHS